MSSMPASSEPNALTVTRGDLLFDRVVETMLAQLRAHLGVPETVDPDDPASAIIEAEFAQAREKLRAFAPMFAEAYSELLTRHVGAEHLPEVLEALADARVQRYLSATYSMEPDLLKTMEDVGRRMSESLCAN